LQPIQIKLRDLFSYLKKIGARMSAIVSLGPSTQDDEEI
jgi:hypothetical protein